LPDLIRAFVAVLIDPVVVDAVYSTQRRLSEIAPQLKWVNSSNFHLTVKFLGEIPDKSLQNVFDAVIKSADEAEPFDLNFKGIGVFGSAAKPRVVWVGTTEGAEQLGSLAESVDKHLQSVGFAGEERSFKAHLTLARSGREEKALPEEFRSAIKDSAELEFGKSRVDSLVVMRSELRPGGPKYTPMGVFKLHGGGLESVSS
jgi:2'-5' RNA ligase